MPSLSIEPMKIAIVWKGEYPWDIRVEKFCKALGEDGHELHLLCRNGRREKTLEHANGIWIHRLRAFAPRVLGKVLSIPAFFNPYWFYEICSLARKTRIEAIIVRDLPLSVCALMAGRLLKLPVVFDMAENYPAMWRDTVDRGGAKFYNHILKNHLLADAVERFVLHRADHTIVVVDESRDRVLKKGVDADKLSVVSNTPEIRVFGGPCDAPGEKRTDKLSLLYVGGVDSRSRGLDTVLKAIPLIKKKTRGFIFTVAGDGIHLAPLKDLARKLHVEEHVRFMGWVDFKEVPAMIRSSDVCIVPHEVNAHVNTTIPNKLFDYMACRKPVMVSDAMPLKRIVEKCRCGVVFASGDESDLANKLLSLRDTGVRAGMGENGYEAVMAEFNWARDSETLKGIFRRLGSAPSPGDSAQGHLR